MLPKENQAMATGNMHKKLSWDEWFLKYDVDRHRHVHHKTPHPDQGGVIKNMTMTETLLSDNDNNDGDDGGRTCLLSTQSRDVCTLRVICMAWGTIVAGTVPTPGLDDVIITLLDIEAPSRGRMFDWSMLDKLENRSLNTSTL